MNNPRNVPGIRKQYIGHVTLGEKRAVREAGTARGGGWGGGGKHQFTQARMQHAQG